MGPTPQPDPPADTAQSPPHPSPVSLDSAADKPTSVVDSDANVSPSSKKQSRFAFWKKKTNDSVEKKEAPPSVKISELFRYTTSQERLYMVAAFIAAAIHGAILPVFTIFFGSIINSFGPDSNQDEIVAEIGDTAKWFFILGAVAFVSSTVQVQFQLMVAQQTCARIRRRFFSSLMSQDYTWLDSNDGGELTSRVAGDVNLIQAGIGDKAAAAMQFFATFVVGVIIAFIYGPLLTLVILAVAPLLMIGGAVFGKLATDSTGDGLGAYGQAGAVANEVLGLIRTVTAYNGQKSEIARYDRELARAYKSNVKLALYTALGLGFTMFVMFCSYAIAFAFGSDQVRRKSMEGGDVLTTFFSVIIACFSIGQAAPSFNALAIAQGAAPRVFEVIERQSDINPLDEETGDTLQDFKGHISFSGVDFAYKKRSTDNSADSTGSSGEADPDADMGSPVPDKVDASPTSADDEEEREYILNNFNLDVPPGTAHALVGPSGCGKSTTVRLIERFYDVQHGSVTMDGVDVRTLNVRWLRSQMGYVGQMPTLFMLSIRDNIALGAAMEQVSDEKSGKVVLRRKEVTDDDIIAAAKMANAHDFIMRLPEQYDTMLGERGALLSGGQKQRVCIARALIRNPRILILDESTAALDAQSERLVQEALEKASSGRTTITIAHRLSTVKNADVISVIEKGTIVEAGNHHELMGREDGAYRTLVENQNIEALKVKEMSEGRKEDDDKGEGDEAQVFKDSVTKTQKVGEGVEEESDEPAVDKGIWKRAFWMNRAEIPYILLGVLGAAGAGSNFPVMAIIFAEVIREIQVDNRTSEIRKYSLLFVAIGVGAFFCNFFHYLMLGISGERLTKKTRGLAFRAMLKQEMGFFDNRENALGALTTRLATESTLIKGITGDTLGTAAFAAGSIITGFLVAYLACWRVALVVTGVFPLMAIAGALQMKVMTGFDSDSGKKYMQAGAVASEAVDNFDTVTSVGVQDVFMDRYNQELEAPIANGKRTALVAGLAFGLSEFFSQALWGVSFWVGSIFVEDGYCDFEGLMKAVSGLLFAGMMLGQVTTMMPDLAKSRVAATKIFRLLDRESSIDPTVEGGSQEALTGNVMLDHVNFEYPTRPDVPVLRGLSVSVEQGKTLALVGASGCGKSTVIALLERFYDPRTGTIKIDDTEVKDFNMKQMRTHISLVSQEPDLFNRSVRDNIAYGLSHDEGTVVTDEMITQAAMEANAHTFISELSEGYDTVVGVRGQKLSGGQRQRVAIARAIVGGPRILLLDEATSALDAVSERVVQEALDKAGSGRTTVAIAHRLSTVKDADAIAVVARGKIVEIGTHEQLLRIENGEYANLVKNQLAGEDENMP